jgi:predicted nucleic acid-binding protein
MKEIFIDTSAWDAIEDAKDPNHKIVLSFTE